MSPLMDHTAKPAPERTGPPDWRTVEKLITDLGATGEVFPGEAARTYRIERCDPGWRARVESHSSSRWVEIEDIRTCWEAFERLGRIRREDVLEPARCPSFIMALFAQVPGVERADEDTPCLVLRTPAR